MSLPRPAAGGESCLQDSFLPYRKVLRQKDIDWRRTEGSSWSVEDTFLHNRKLRHSVVENQQELQSNSWGVGPAANSFLCTAPCRGNNPLCGTRGAQRVGEDESSLLDYTVPRRGNKPPFHHAKIICPIIFPAVQAYKSIGQSTSKGWNPQVCVCAASTNL